MDEYLDLSFTQLNMDALKYVPMDIAINYCIFPFNIKDKKLYLAVTDKFNSNIMEELKFIFNVDLLTFKSNEDDIINLIHKYYRKYEVNKVVTSLKYDKNEKLQGLEINKEVSPVEKITNYIIEEAIIKHSSDIHIEPFPKEAIIRFRIDGILYKIKQIPLDVYYNLLGRIKILSNIDTTEKRIPQDGKFVYEFRRKKYDLRVSTLPIVDGEKLAIRILDKSDRFKKLSSLGFNKQIDESMKNIINKRHGIFLITGPTGSGKSTTLYAILNEMDKEHKNIITLEDPIEYSIKGINQVNINPKIGLDFSLGLKSIVRQDPDIIMIGEIRDEETAQMAIRAAITGHLVLATMHTNDAISSILRLIDMGVPTYLLADAMIGVMAQRLIRKLCPYCKEKESNESAYYIYSSKGCKKCNNGYFGRIAVCELVEFTNEHKRLIAKGFSIDRLREFSIKHGMKTLKNNGMELVESGKTSMQEIINL
ncbi:GspE/PulE family protein [Clostridium rectalis]|uniref:GspE/PulE family protein n=1 Tax=Clostridium rectalis TaxID=2040295 RepID=UPI000F63C5E8|nr:GspE/PulE family protein [Clostridium rectalis]